MWWFGMTGNESILKYKEGFNNFKCVILYDLRSVYDLSAQENSRKRLDTRL